MASPVPKVNPDLAKERLNCPFPLEELTNLLDGGPEKTAERRRVQKVYFEHPEVGSIPGLNKGRKDLYCSATQ